MTHLGCLLAQDSNLLAERHVVCMKLVHLHLQLRTPHAGSQLLRGRASSHRTATLPCTS
jgi:hypothetical protein